MYTIALCDDDINYADMIHSLVLEFAGQLSIGVDILKFDSGKKFLELLKNGSTHFDIIFLDIDMPELSGLETADTLRSKGIDSVLIFVTSMEDKVFEAFGYNALRFVLKRNLKRDLQDAFVKAIETLNQSKNLLSFKTGEGIIRLAVTEIFYFIFENRKVNAVCRNNASYALNSMTLSNIEEMMSDKGFISINRYVLVNVKYVNGINKNSLTMDNGEVFDISRPKLKNVYKLIADYLKA